MYKISSWLGELPGTREDFTVPVREVKWLSRRPVDIGMLGHIGDHDQCIFAGIGLAN